MPFYLSNEAEGQNSASDSQCQALVLPFRVCLPCCLCINGLLSFPCCLLVCLVICLSIYLPDSFSILLLSVCLPVLATLPAYLSEGSCLSTCLSVDTTQSWLDVGFPSVQGAVLTVIAQQRLVHMLEDVRAGNVPSGQHRGSEQDLQRMTEVAK